MDDWRESAFMIPTNAVTGNSSGFGALKRTPDNALVITICTMSDDVTIAQA